MAPPQSETHNSHSYTSPQPNLTAFNAELRSIYIDFLRRMSYENSPEASSPDAHLQEVVAACTALCGSYMPANVITASAGFPVLICKYHPLDAKIKIAHFTCLGIIIDDLSQSLTGQARDKFLEDIALFQMKMCDPQGYDAAYPGRGDLHEALEDFIYFMRTEQNPFFPSHPRSLTMMVKSCYDFLEGNLLEQHYEEHPLNYRPEMRLFSNFLRQKTGLAEAYASMVVMDTSGKSSTTPIIGDRFYYNNIHPVLPEIVECLCLGNDAMSFYKEMEDGETAITIMINAKVKNLSPLDSLREITDHLVDQRNRIMAIVEASGSLEWKKRMVQFYQGYLSWHLGSKRYRLKALLGDWYQGEYWT